MRNSRAAVAGVATLTLIVASACADTSPTEPRAEVPDQAALFGGGPLPFLDVATIGIDAEFVRIAQEIPGFGGWYYDAAGTLNVIMVPAMRSMAEGEVQVRLASHLQAMGQDPASAHTAMFRPGEYDFIQLNAIHRQVMSVLSLAGVVYTDADEVLNRVTVGVENAAAAEAVEQALAMLDVPRGGIVLLESGPVIGLVGDIGQMSLQSRIRPVAGGLQIQGTGLCTLGMNVRSVTATVQGFITSHHCTQTPGMVQNTQFWQPTAAPENRIGVEVRDTTFQIGGVCPAGRRCRFSATTGVRYFTGVPNAFARIYRTAGVNTGSVAIDGMFNITAERAFPSVGNIMHKVGRTTGWTSGTVSQSCQMINVPDSDITYRCQEVVTGDAGIFGAGDGGAPVFEPTPGGGPNDVRVVGMAWGQTAANNFVFSAMFEIRSDNPARPAGAGGAWRIFPPPPAP